MNKLTSLLLSGAFAALALSASTASADLGACNDVFVSGQAKCEVVPPSVDCEKRCTPLTITAVCSARLAASCDASCDKVPSVDCSGSCMASCSGECTVDPGKFDCQGTCEADCSGQCAADCKSKGDATQCTADCQGSCSVSCKKSCDVVAPSANCDGKCKASCDGRCKVETNLDCQVDCQAKGYASCQADVMGGCSVACKGKQGALFCDGQFVDYGDNLSMCVDALKQRFSVSVSGESSGSSSCDAGECTAQGSAKVKTKCSVVDPGAHSSNWLGFAALGLGLAGWSARRRRR